MYSFELNNAHRDEVQINNTDAFKKVVEICSALISGNDTDKYGKDKDGVVAKLKDLGSRAEMGDYRARSEINTIVKFIVQPKLLESMKVFNFLGNYKEIGFDQQAVVKTYTYEGLNARIQASGGDVAFPGRKWIEYPVPTKTISSGMVIDYRELASGNFGGNIAEETAQITTDMNNKSVAYVLSVLHEALRNNTDFVSFYGQYSGTPTQTAVDDMIAKVRRMGKVNISGDFSVLSTICDWNGYKTVGSTPIPFYTEAQVNEIARAGLNGFYKGTSLIELPNPYNFTKPLDDKSAFETYNDIDKLYFTVQGANSPFHIFRRGGLTSMSGNDVETGVIKTRFDIEVGADVTKGREFEIGLLEKA